MVSYLDFEKSLSEIEGKIRELNEARLSSEQDDISLDEITKLEKNLKNYSLKFTLTWTLGKRLKLLGTLIDLIFLIILKACLIILFPSQVIGYLVKIKL